VKVLLDECIDRRLAKEIIGHDVRTVPQVGWAGLTNGELLSRAVGRFDAFVTLDRNLSFQQNAKRYELAILVLAARSNRLEDVRLLVPRLLRALPTAKPGVATWIEG